MIVFVYILAFLKNAIYGVSVFFTGKLVASTDVFDVLALRFLMSWVVFELLKQIKILKINIGIKDYCGKTERSKYFKPLLFSALFEPILYMLFETIGISMTTGVMTGVLLSLMPISCVICESILLKEKTSLLEKFFLLIGIVGVIYITANSSGRDGENSVLGIVFILLAIVSGALYMVFSRKSSTNFNSIEITYFASFLGMIVFNGINIIRHLICGDILRYFFPYLSIENMIGFVFLSVVSTILATGMNNFALGRIKTSTMSAFGGISTLVTIAAGVFLNGEKLYTYHYIGITLIIVRMVGVCYLAWHKIQTNNKTSKIAIPPKD